MKKISELKDVLYKYVKDYIDLEKKRDCYLYNIDLYEEILTHLNNYMLYEFDDGITFSICLETLFGNKYNDLIQYIYVSKMMYSLNKKNEENDLKISKLANEIKMEYEEQKKKCEKLNNEISLNQNKVISARRIMSSLKYSQTISRYDIINVNDILRKLGYSGTDVSFIIERLFIHNKDVLSKQKGYKYYDKYRFIKLLSLGYEDFEYPDVLDEGKLSSISNVMFDMLQSYYDDINEEDYIKIIPVIGENVSDINELEFVLIKLLEKIRNRIDELVDLIKDKDFIMDLEIKNEVAADCYDLISKYNYFRKYMDDILSKYSVEEDKIEAQNEKVRNNIFYLNNVSGNCYLLSDLKKMKFEYLEKAYKLIEDLKNNSISKKKTKRMTENANVRGFLELKDDQIRIIYKKINDNNYLIYGAFIKKDDRKYKVQFNSVVTRTGVISSDSLVIEEELHKYVDENSRKWSR